MTGPKTDPRPGDTARGPGSGRLYTVRARRGDVVDLEYTPDYGLIPSEGVRVLRHTGALRMEGVPLATWAEHTDHARRSRRTDPRVGDTVDDYVVEGVDTEHVWVRQSGMRKQATVPRDRWATWAPH